MPNDTWRKKPQGPAYIVGVTDFVHRVEPPRLASRAAMYRCVLQHLRLLPDPVIWAHVAPMMRKLCASYKRNTSETQAFHPAVFDEVGSEQAREQAVRWQEEKKRKKSLEEAKSMLAEVRAAVAAHPHALLRLLRRSYNQIGYDKWGMYREIARTSPGSTEIRKHEKHLGPTRPPVPKPLLPLARVERSPSPRDALDGSPNAREETTQRQARIQWVKQHETLNIPLRFPKNTGVRTGIENDGVIETIQVFAKVAQEYDKYGPPRGIEPASHLTEREMPTEEAFTVFPLPRTDNLPSFDKLPLVLQKVFPRKLKPTMREPALPKPPRAQTKSNPGTWKNPVRLTPRLLTRQYQRLWDSLVWVRPKTEDVQGDWVRCNYESMLLYEQGRFEELRELDRRQKWAMEAGPRSRIAPMSDAETAWLRDQQWRESKRTVDRVLTRQSQDRPGGSG